MNLIEKIVASGILSLAAGFVACGDDSSSGVGNNSLPNSSLPEKIESFSDVEDFDCNGDRECESIYINESGLYAQCIGEKWVKRTFSRLNACDEESSSSKGNSSSSAKSSSSVVKSSSSSAGKSSDSKYAFVWNTFAEAFNCTCDKSREGWLGLARYADDSELICYHDDYLDRWGWVDATRFESSSSSAVLSSSSSVKSSSSVSSSSAKSSSSVRSSSSVVNSSSSVRSSSSVSSSSAKSSSSVRSSSSVVSSSSSVRSSSSVSSSSAKSSSSVRSSSSVVKSSSSVESSSSIAVVDPSTVVKGTLTDDRDGVTYKTVTIGNQTWMAENLKLNYNVGSAKSWCGGGSGNNEGDCNKYGRLYTWAAAMDSAAIYSYAGEDCGYGKHCPARWKPRGICPQRWHLPSKAELDELVEAVGGSSVAGTMLRSTSGWDHNENGSDLYGFTALPTGFRYPTYFDHTGLLTSFWGSTEDDIYAVIVIDFGAHPSASVGRGIKSNGSPIRCLKN